MTTIDYLTEQQYIPLWNRHREKILKNEKIRSHFFHEDGRRKQGTEDLEARLKGDFLNRYKQREEFINKGPNIFRYIGNILSGVGALTTLGAVVGVATKMLPLVAGATAMASGLRNILYGAASNTIADVKDAGDANRAIDGKFNMKQGYLARTASGTWNLIKDAINPMTYLRNLKQLAEGLLYRAASYLGFSYFVYSPTAIGLDMYRGKRKFENRVLDDIVNETIDSFKGIVPEQKMRPEKRILPIQDNPTEGPYQGMRLLKGGKPAKKLGYVPPRQPTALEAAA